MAPADADAAEKSPFRWIDAARYVVASVVVVLIVAVVVNAIKLVRRPESLLFSVPGGCVPMARIDPSPPPTLFLQLSLRAENPARRARMYYVNIKAYLFDVNVSAASLNPEDDSIAFFSVKDKVVAQQKAVVATEQIGLQRRKSMDRSYFDKLYSGNGSTIFSHVTMRLDGTLITESRSDGNASSRPTTYYCPQLLVGGDSPDNEAFKNRPEVVCST